MGFLGLGKDTLGEVPVPGEATVTLPAGEVELRYAEKRKGRQVSASSGKTWRGPEEDLEVIVATAAGEQLEVRKAKGVQEGAARTIYRKLAYVDIPADGECTVIAAMTVTPQQIEPRILLRG